MCGLYLIIVCCLTRVMDKRNQSLRLFLSPTLVGVRQERVWWTVVSKEIKGPSEKIEIAWGNWQSGILNFSNQHATAYTKSRKNLYRSRYSIVSLRSQVQLTEMLGKAMQARLSANNGMGYHTDIESK